MVGSDAYGQSRYDDANRDNESWYDGLGRDRGSGRLQKEELQKRDMTPGFRREQNNRDGARNNLRAMERGANGMKGGGNLAGVGAAEKREKSGFYNPMSGRGINKKKDDGRNKNKGFLRRKGSIITIILALALGVGGTSFFGISTELVAWKENMYSKFGQSSAVINRRSNYMMRGLLSTNKSTTNFFNNKFKISSKLSKKLSAKGIDYVEMDDVNGKKLKMLVFEDTDGRRIPIVASDSDVPRANTLVGTDVDIDGTKVRITDSSLTLTEARRVNKNFDVSYDAATITFTGKIAGWFDNITESMFNRLVGKNARNQMNIDDPDEESVNKLLFSNASEGLEDSDVKALKQKTDEDGKPVEEGGKPVYVDANADDVAYVDSDGRSVTVGEAESENGGMRPTAGTDVPDTDTVKASLSARAKKVAMMSTTVGCAVLRAMGAISSVVGAVQTINAISFATKWLNAADQIKNGDGNEAINIALNSMNKSVTTELYDVNGERVSVSGAITEGDGWNTVFSSTNLVDENDPSALAVNRELANKNALRSVIGNDNYFEKALTNAIGAMSSWGAGVAAFRYCNAIQGLAGVVSLVGDVVSVLTLGIGKAVKDIVGGAIKGAKIAAAMIIIGTVLNLVTPTIAKWFAGRLDNIFLGKTGGFAMFSGARNIMDSNLQMGTGRYADRENAIETFALTRDVEKEWAAYERATRSPFDVTSRYTFLGAIYNSILPIANTSGGTALSTVSSVANLTKASVVSLVSPSAIAASEANDFAASLASEGSCSYLESVGVAGDFACNKYSGAYVDEIDTVDPETTYENMVKYGSFDGEDSDGNPKVNMKSDYAKYIVACVSSDTQPGTMSGAVQGFLTGMEKDLYDTSVVASGLVNFGRNFIPFEGFLDAVEAAEEEKNMKWNSGLACTGNTDNDDFNEMVKNFSMYNLDQRVLYNMGILESNSTVSFLEEYYEQNPLDYSFEGQVARFSGMSKEEVNDTLALIEYWQFLDEYDASDRYAFGAPAVEVENRILFDNDNVVADNVYIITLNNILYADVRNRSFAV